MIDSWFAALLVVLAFMTGMAAGNTFIGGHSCNSLMDEPLPREYAYKGKPGKLKEWCLYGVR